jgi:DNA-binding response OmpR family regulator
MKNVLIVEDDKDMNNILCLVLADRGFNVTSYFDAPTALKNIDIDRYDLLILDYKLPGMTGLEFLVKLREFKPQQKVLMLSAHGDIRLKEEAAKYKVKHFLDKPFNIEELVGTVESYIGE